MAAAAPPTPRPRRRRWPVVLGVLVLLGLLLAWWIDRQLEPNRLAATVLDRAGNSLQLRFTFKGTPEYALKPEPRLLLPGLSVAGMDGKPFLTARRAEISLPWATITGGELVITRLQLEQPVVRIAVLQRWLASRPPTPFRLPTLTRGLQMHGATLIGEDFVVDRLTLELPHLRAGEPADLAARGRYTQGSTRLDATMQLHLDTPGLVSAYRLGVAGVLQRQPKPLAFKLDSRGKFASTDALLSLDADTLALSGDSPLPRIAGKAMLRSSKQLQFGFDGVLRDWPAVWPALPEPLRSQTSNLPVHLAYTGGKDLADPLSLRVDKAPTMLDASLRVPELRQWLSATDASPLPPIAGTLRTPVLVFDGVTLEGVYARFSAQ
jgi:hypothetical protein